MYSCGSEKWELATEEKKYANKFFFFWIARNPSKTNINMDGTQMQDVPPNTCPQCKRQQLSESYTVCGLVWAICCFPCGLLCCLTMKDKKCRGCGYGDGILLWSTESSKYNICKKFDTVSNKRSCVQLLH
jgi:hypothetical protein